MTERHDILLVDDDEALRLAVSTLLEDDGYSVYAAGNGREALAYLATHEPPSLILLDLVMPVLDGWQFLIERERASEPGERSVPVVLMSGMGFIQDARGFADFLRKPIDPPLLLNCARRFCRASSSRSA